MEMQRRLCIRLVRGYRTISGEAAPVLSGSVPWTLLAEAYATIYNRHRALRAQGVVFTSRVRNAVRSEAYQAAIDRWYHLLVLGFAVLRPFAQCYEHGLTTPMAN